MLAVYALIIIETLAVIIGGYGLYKWWKAPASSKPPQFWIALCSYIVGISGFIFGILSLIL